MNNLNISEQYKNKISKESYDVIPETQDDGSFLSPAYLPVAIPITDIINQEYNPNIHSEKSFKALQTSILNTGYTFPILVAENPLYNPDLDESEKPNVLDRKNRIVEVRDPKVRQYFKYVIVDGSHRYSAMIENEEIYNRENGKIPCIVLRNKTQQELMSAEILMNPVHENQEVKIINKESKEFKENRDIRNTLFTTKNAELLIKNGLYIDYYKENINILPYTVKLILIKNNYFLDEFSNDDSWEIRREIAKKGYNLEKFKNDLSIEVRVEVVKHGYDLDYFLNDESKTVLINLYNKDKKYLIPIEYEEAKEKYLKNEELNLKSYINSENVIVRCYLASLGLELDKFINDKSELVRAVVAKQGYNLSVLKYDKSEHVRAAVASMGYSLDHFIFDKSYLVLKELINQNYELEYFSNSKDSKIKLLLIKKGYKLEKFVNDEDEYIRAAVAKKGFYLDKLMNDESYIVRFEVANQGYKLDHFKNDESLFVHDALIHNNYNLDYYLNHESSDLKRLLVIKGYKLEHFINDNDSKVRFEVANQGYGLDTLINDKSEYVRIAVANQGYGLDILINDSSEKVRNAVKSYLKYKN